MHAPTPATEDLQTFLAIAQAGTLSGAAAALRTPKSTLSRRLARLEEALGARLFLRNRQRLTLSDSGRSLLEPAQAAMDALRGVVAAAEQRREEASGRLRVSIPLDLLSLRELWLSFSLKHPRVALELEPTNRHVDLVAERFDLALRGGRGADGSLVARAVGAYRLVAVASPDYLARWGKLESPAALRRHSCLLFRELGHRPGHPDRPEPPHRHIICPDEAFALEAARCGLGVAILREDIAAAELERGALCIALEAYNPLNIPLYAVYPDKSYQRAALTAFIQHIEDRFGEDAPGARLSSGP